MLLLSLRYYCDSQVYGSGLCSGNNHDSTANRSNTARLPFDNNSTALRPFDYITTVWRCCSNNSLIMPRSHSGALSDDARLTTVCLSRTSGPNSRTERPRKTKIGTEVAHVTRDSDTTFKVKWLKVNLQGAGHIVAASRAACYCYYYYY